MYSHWFNPAPRIGFAWDPTGDGKTSIRGGYGIFFEHGTGNETNTGSLEGSAPLILNMTQSFPFHYQDIGEFGTYKNLAFPLNVTAIQKKAVWPYMQQWSLSVQREFGGGLLASVAYVGSKGTHLTAEQQINQLKPVDSASNPFPPRTPITRATCRTYGGDAIGQYFRIGGQTIHENDPGFLNTYVACIGAGVRDIRQPDLLLFPVDANSFRQYRGFGQIFSLSNTADSSYHAFQSTVRRTRGPLILSLSYTYSHSLDNSSDRSNSTFVNSLDLRSNKANSNFDQRHLLNLSYILQLDFKHIGRVLARGSSLLPEPNSAAVKPRNALPQNASSTHAGIGSGIVDTLFQGWELSGLTTYQSGTPFTVINGGTSTGISLLDNAGVANGIGAGSYPDIVGDPRIASSALNDVAKSFGPLLGNPSAFVAPRGLTFGNAGRNRFNNPVRLNFDMSLLKHFKMGELRYLEFRIEAFNVFNHTQFRVYNPDRGNTASNIISCYGGPDLSAAGGRNADGTTTDCLTGNAFLHPVDAHRPRTMQFGLKYYF